MAWAEYEQGHSGIWNYRERVQKRSLCSVKRKGCGSAAEEASFETRSRSNKICKDVVVRI